MRKSIRSVAGKTFIHEPNELHRCQLIRKPCHESQKLSQKPEEGKDEGGREGHSTKWRRRNLEGKRQGLEGGRGVGQQGVWLPR